MNDGEMNEGEMNAEGRSDDPPFDCPGTGHAAWRWRAAV